MSEGLLPDPRWQGYTLAQKYEWFKAQPGAGVTAPSAASLGGLGTGVAQSGEVLQNAMATTGVNWQGQAADATGDALARAARWATSNGQLSGTGSAAVDGYGSSWTATKNQIAQPVPEGPEAWWDHVSSLFGVQSDYAKNVAANQAANQAADDALSNHYTHTHSALDAFDGPSAVPPLLDGGASSTPTAPPGGNQHTGPASTAGAAGPRAGSEVAPPLGGHAGAATEATGPAGGSGGDTTTPADFTPLPPPATGGATTPAAVAPPTGDAGSAGTQGSGMASGASGGLAADPGAGMGAGTAEPPPLPGTEFVPLHAGGGMASGAGAGAGARVLPGRGGALPGRSAEVGGRSAMPGGEPAEATRSAGAGIGALRPMGEAGAARAGTEPTHHNTTFIPSDEPFFTPLDDDVTLAVIAPDEDGWIPL